MKISVDPAASSLLRRCADDAVLGIILRDGRVILTLSRATIDRDHREWVRRKPGLNASRGFSLMVERGRVRAMFCLSGVNPPPGYMLEAELAQQLEAMLPLAPNYQRFYE